LKYRINGKEKRISLGVYPEVGLKDARDKCDAARKQVADGIDPSVQRKAVKLAGAEKSANSFEVVACEWFGKFSTIIQDVPYSVQQRDKASAARAPIQRR
jgi:hypothetical protein